jgi:hypothetical protein
MQQQDGSVPTCRGWFIGDYQSSNPPMAFDVRACVGSKLILFVVIVFVIVIPVVDRRHRLTSTKVKIY